MLVVPATVLPPELERKAALDGPLLFWMVSVPKVRVPAELFCSDMLFVPPDPALTVPMVVLPKLRSAFELLTIMPWFVEPETLVEPHEKELLPAPSESATLVRL